MKEWKKVTGYLNSYYSIHDSWTEVLTGTYYLLNLMGSETNEFDKLEKLHLARLVIVTSSQLVEIMLLNSTLKKTQVIYVNVV